MSIGILGAVQKQAICVLKARLPKDELLVRKTLAGERGRENPRAFICGVDNLDPEVMSVYPNELVFVRRTCSSAASNMQSFIDEHPVHGEQFVTGDIHVKGFTAFNGLPVATVNDTDEIVYVGTSINTDTCLVQSFFQGWQRDQR